MSNPIFQQMNPMNNIQQVLQRLKQFQQSFHGDARQQVQQLLNSGKVTQNELFGNNEQFEQMPTYSYASAPDQKQEDKITIDSDTEFARVIDGREQKEIMPVLDELMTTLQAIQPRLYNAVMEKLYR